MQTAFSGRRPVSVLAAVVLDAYYGPFAQTDARTREEYAPTMEELFRAAHLQASTPATLITPSEQVNYLCLLDKSAEGPRFMPATVTSADFDAAYLKMENGNGSAYYAFPPSYPCQHQMTTYCRQVMCIFADKYPGYVIDTTPQGHDRHVFHPYAPPLHATMRQFMVDYYVDDSAHKGKVHTETRAVQYAGEPLRLYEKYRPVHFLDSSGANSAERTVRQEYLPSEQYMAPVNIVFVGRRQVINADLYNAVLNSLFAGVGAIVVVCSDYEGNSDACDGGSDANTDAETKVDEFVFEMYRRFIATNDKVRDVFMPVGSGAAEPAPTLYADCPVKSMVRVVNMACSCSYPDTNIVRVNEQVANADMLQVYIRSIGKQSEFYTTPARVVPRDHMSFPPGFFR